MTKEQMEKAISLNESIKRTNWILKGLHGECELLIRFYHTGGCSTSEVDCEDAMHVLIDCYEKQLASLEKELENL